MIGRGWVSRRCGSDVLKPNRGRCSQSGGRRSCLVFGTAISHADGWMSMVHADPPISLAPIWTAMGRAHAGILKPAAICWQINVYTRIPFVASPSSWSFALCQRRSARPALAAAILGWIQGNLACRSAADRATPNGQESTSAWVRGDASDLVGARHLIHSAARRPNRGTLTLPSPCSRPQAPSHASRFETTKQATLRLSRPSGGSRYF